MRNRLALLLSLPLAACVVGPEDPGMTGGGGGGSGSGSGNGSGSGVEGISGAITASTSWSGSLLISGITTIDPGVTVTVAAGTTLTFKGVASLQVKGILDVQGTSAGVVTIKPETQGFGGVNVLGGGEIKYKFVDQYGGGIISNGSAKVTLVDTHMSRVAGDFLMMNGGTLDMSYSQIGMEPGETDTTHCNMHFGGAGNVIKVNHSNISTSSFGLMFYGGMNADFKMNNWYSNDADVDVSTTSPVTGDFSSGWFEKGAPSGAGITAATLSTTRLAECDGTNDAACAGIH